MGAEAYRTSNLLMAGLTIIFIAVSSYLLGQVAGLIARWRGATPGSQRRAFIGYFFAAPWIVGFVIFVVGPALASLYYSFTNYKIGDPMQWIGLDNYRNLLMGQNAAGRQFSQAMFNSFYYALIGVPLQIVIALGMAMLLNREWPGIRIFRTVFYLPVILAGGPALLLSWRYMLNANGGFINVALQKFAQSFFVFGYLYRLFIYLSESFNGFYIGLTRGDPVGPFAYALPALLGMLVLLSLAFGEWTESKRVRAWRAAQLMGLIVLYVLAFRGLVAQPIDLSWTYFASILTTIVILMSASARKKGQLRAVQICGVVLFSAGMIFTLVAANGSFSEDAVSYLLALALGVVPILISFFGSWDRRKYRLLAGIAILFGLVIFVRCIPGQLDGGKLSMIPRYLTFQSTMERTDDLNYLKTTYVNDAVSPLWVWSMAVAALIGGALLNARYPRARRILLYGALAFFVLFTIGTVLDGVRYFQAFDTIAQATGKPAYHFTLFRASINNFPAADRVPLWMTNELWSKPSLILITLWSSGTGMLIFLAALKGVPRSLYEAAEVDGANGIQKFFRITLPMISPAMFYNMVIGIIAALQTFDTVYVLQNTQTESSLASAAYALFTRTFRQLYIGEGSAISWILVIIIMTITVIQFRFSGWVYYEA